MEWYSAKMVFHIETHTQTPQFDEQIRLIQALNREHALETAYQTGLLAQEEFLNNNGNLLRWTFIAVTEINYIGALENGKEIHYQITEADEADLYLQRIEEKALNLKKLVADYDISSSMS